MKRILSTILSLLLLTSLTAQTDEHTEALEQMKQLLPADSLQAAQVAEQLLHGKNKKNVSLVVAVARIYLDAGHVASAEALLPVARRADATYPSLSVLEGDLALKRQDAGTACRYYEQAIYFDPHCHEAYLKYALAYRSVAPALAIEKLQQLKSLQPDLPEADRALAEVYYSINRFGKAIDAYARFIDTPVATDDDLLHYAFALFLNHDFERSLSVARRGLQRDTSHIAFRRLELYNNVDLQRYPDARRAAIALDAALPDSALTYLDHRYCGTLCMAEEHYPDALDHYRQALEKDSTQQAVWADISEVCERAGDYPGAISAYLHYYRALPADRQMPEQLFRLGRLYYAEGTSADTLSVQHRHTALQTADSIFARVDTLVPDSYLGNLWRARTCSALDPETTAGLAKPYYEEVAATLLGKADERYNAALVECYSYLGYYHLLQSNYPESVAYWEKVLLIDPQNATAGKALAGIKKM